MSYISSAPAIPTLSCAPLRRPEVLDRFTFDNAQLKPAHQAQIDNIARCIIASQPGAHPIRSLHIVGHTDPVGSDAYNLALGRRRAEQVRRVLKSRIEHLHAGLTRRLTLLVQTRGESQPLPGDSALSRRVEIFALRGKPSPGTGKPVMPREPRCAVVGTSRARTMPGTSIRGLSGWPVRYFGDPAPTPEPKLCLYLEADADKEPAAAALFKGQAERWAKKSHAVRAAPCKKDIGATAYRTGADIIAALVNGYECLDRQPIKEVHLFGHMFEEGVIGTREEFAGLYRERLVHFRSRDDRKVHQVDIDDPQWVLGPGDPRVSSRQIGARVIAEIPTDILDDKVTVVLHGCNTAKSDPKWVVNQKNENFAKALFSHLAATRRNPTVFGHPTSVCAGEDRSWRRYRFVWTNGVGTPEVKTLPASRSLSPIYTDGSRFCKRPPVECQGSSCPAR